MALEAKKKESDELEKLIGELPGEEIPLDIDPEGDEKIPLDPETGLDPEKLETELNDLKDLVQDEINKMMEENPDAEWKDIVKEAKDEKTNRGKTSGKLCVCCEENIVDDDEDYCEDCLEIMRHYPFDWWKWIIPVITIALMVLAFSYFAISFSVYKSTVSANKLVKAGNLNSALTAFDNINTEIKVTDKNYGYRYLNYQIDLYNKLGVEAFEDEQEFLDNYFPGTNINKKRAKKALAAKEEIDAFNKLYENFNAVYNPDGKFEDFLKDFDKKNKGENFSEGYVNYFKYYAATYYGEKTSVIREYAEKVQGTAPEKKSLYLPLLAEVCLNEGKYDDMLKAANELKGFNNDSPYVYMYQAIAYRLQGNLPKALAVCNEGIKVQPQNSLVNYQMAIITLLNGKKEEAYQYASDALAYASDINSFVSASSLASLCAQLLEDKESNDQIVEQIEAYGYEISPQVEQIISGKITIEDVFTKEKGDFKWAQ